MGISTDAHLLYGFEIGFELGLRSTALRLGFRKEAEEQTIQELEVLISEFLPKGIELVLTGHIDGCPSYFLAAGVERAHRGFPIGVNLAKLQRKEPKFNKAFSKLPKTFTETPTWWLVPYTDF